jgi:endogenous inhibitor of DNA gyrase (YacG/DUF329 family)
MSNLGGVFARGGKKPSEMSRFCPTCGKKATWVDEYQRWYCYNDKKYLDS